MQLTALALWLNTAFAGFDEAVATAIHQLYVAAGWFFTPFLTFISLLGKGAGRSTAAAAAAEPGDGRRRTLVIDGANFSTMDGLFREFNRLFDVGPDEAVHSLDALNDLLGGGIGKIPAGARLHIRWLNSEKSREDFGYGATVIYYEKLLRRCHPNNRPRMEALLAEARRGEGETLFEKLTALIARTDTGHDCTLSLE